MASIWGESFVHSFGLGRALMASQPEGIKERVFWAEGTACLESGGDGGPLWPPEVGVRGRTLPKSGEQSWRTLTDSFAERRKLRRYEQRFHSLNEHLLKASALCGAPCWCGEPGWKQNWVLGKESVSSW